MQIGYRAVQHPEGSIELHMVRCNKAGDIVDFTVSPVQFYGETQEEMAAKLSHAARDVKNTKLLTLEELELCCLKDDCDE
jgi:hypothetical protein